MKNRIFFFLVVVLWVIGVLIDEARADFNVGNALVVHGTSWHADRASDYNELNAGLGIRMGRGGYFLTVGGYKNSLYETSVYAGAGKTLWSHGPLRAGVLGGLISGYNTGILPFILPEVSIHSGNFAAIVNFVPAFNKHGVVSLSLAYGF